MSCCACQPRAISDDEGATQRQCPRDTAPVAQAPRVTNCFLGPCHSSFLPPWWFLGSVLLPGAWPETPGLGLCPPPLLPACVTLDCHSTSLSFWLLIYKQPGLLSAPFWQPGVPFPRSVVSRDRAWSLLEPAYPRSVQAGPSPHFTDEETEAWRGDSLKAAEPCCKPRMGCALLLGCRW